MSEEQKELERIEKRLQELRIEWKNSSLSYQKFIETGAKILKERKEFLLKKIEEKEKRLMLEA